jgi:hypothetical protein
VVLVAFARAWVLLLGMSGLIVLFWFLKGGEVLRYLVSSDVSPFSCRVYLAVYLGVIHRRHVVPLCPLGRDWCVLFFGLEMGRQWSLIIICGVTPTDDTIARKVNTSDASAFAKICGCFPSQGMLIIALFYLRGMY